MNSVKKTRQQVVLLGITRLPSSCDTLTTGAGTSCKPLSYTITMVNLYTTIIYSKGNAT